MKALTIKDLSITEELDAKGMTAVRGGFCGFTMPAYCSFPVVEYKPSSYTTSVVIGQANNQQQCNATQRATAPLSLAAASPLATTSKASTRWAKPIEMRL
jgi:hypothetical protein